MLTERFKYFKEYIVNLQKKIEEGGYTITSILFDPIEFEIEYILKEKDISTDNEFIKIFYGFGVEWYRVGNERLGIEAYYRSIGEDISPHLNIYNESTFESLCQPAYTIKDVLEVLATYSVSGDGKFFFGGEQVHGIKWDWGSLHLSHQEEGIKSLLANLGDCEQDI